MKARQITMPKRRTAGFPSRYRPCAPRRSPRCASLLSPLLVASLATSCATIEKGAYGIDEVRFEGVEQMGEKRLANCLLSVERPTFGITLGIAPEGCASPPFDADPPRLSLWSWGWTDYQSFNASVLDADLDRVLRWYRARGFYDARVHEVRYDPPEAADPSVGKPPGACDIDTQQCEVDITIIVDEGEPITVGSIKVEGRFMVPNELWPQLEAAELPEVGQRFDEHDYDRGKSQLAQLLAEGSYAAAKVRGTVTLDHGAKTADIVYRLLPGKPYRFGKVTVEGHGTLSDEAIIATAAVDPDAPYRPSTLTEVQQEVYALGAFTSVTVRGQLDRAKHIADIRITVALLPEDRWRLGIGVLGGALRRTEGGELTSVPQWDVHLFGRYERRHIFGTLGKLTIEERPRAIFQRSFPAITVPDPGNVIKLRVNQPALIERRTDAIFTTQWGVGPDTYLGFMRHDLLFRLSAKRIFFRRTLFTTLSLQQDVFIVPAGAITSDGSATPSGYGYSFLEEDIVVDLRDNAAQPTRGAYFQLLASQAPAWQGSSWTAFRLAPQARGFLPLPLHMVVAARVGIGAMFITSAADGLDATSAELGPTNYRLRGGGATSNRGFLPGTLGAGLDGGLRRWEASAELRVRLGASFEVVGFSDFGDVIRAPILYFTEPNPSAGFGFRYLTPVGAIRFDAGFRLGDPAGEPDNLPLLDVPGALHLTLGEAF